MNPNLTLEQVFEEILSGRMNTFHFEQWVYSQRSEAYENGYSDANYEHDMMLEHNSGD